MKEIGTELRKCPTCGGDIRLMFGLMRVPQCYAECKKCKREYSLPTVKVKTLKNLSISKTTKAVAKKAWNKQDK